jgi:hypothetical protein
MSGYANGKDPRTDRRDMLFDLLAAAPKGLNINQIAYMLSCSKATAEVAVHDLREYLRGDTINVPCDPDPDNVGGPWLYRLVGSYSEVRQWSGWTMENLENRMRTEQAMLQSMANGSDGRTKEGKLIRALFTGVTNLLAQVEYLRTE